ncbi:unnamed protein product [Linum trigynum]|uniref:Uncharacterized protein n=1 Tax=Linum trigynum TaxID=586398 RepID=A0AAV2CBB9_9ROSI
MFAAVGTRLFTGGGPDLGGVGPSMSCKPTVEEEGQRSTDLAIPERYKTLVRKEMTKHVVGDLGRAGKPDCLNK